jgi:hypothetical protein
MKQQHHPIDLKTYEKGINADANKEILGQRDGEHVDAFNMRSISMDGDNFAKKKIKGESLLYNNVDNRCFLETEGTIDSEYICMMTLEINGNIVEIWAHRESEDNPPFFRVNGQIVAMSPDIPIWVEYPIQYDKNESCIGGEFYVTNNVTPPMVFSLRDLMLNSGMISGGECTQKYFGNFNLEEYTVNISATLHKPIYINWDASTTAYTYTNVLGSLGVPVGYYSYSYRYVTTDGDRSAWSPISELIPVTRSVSQSGAQFPALRTYSDDPDFDSPTTYGNHIRIRTENFSGFDFIEVRRDAWYAGDPIGSPPVSEIIGNINIGSGVSVIEMLDRVASEEVEEVITIDEQTSEMAGIERAKAIRYFNERLYLMNIGYASKDIDATVDFVDIDNLVFPAIHKMGKQGHKSPYNAAHYKSNMRGEKVGFGVALWDAEGNISYVKKIDGAENFQLPNRRTPISGLTSGISYKGTVRAAHEDGFVSQTHEVFDHEDAVTRSSNMSANIFDGSWILNNDTAWNPYNPVSQDDTTNDYGSRVNVEVRTGGVTGSWKTYNPRGFGLNYYSMGIGFKGVDTTTLPDWVSGFSVVQTRPANKVIAQGLGWYAMGQAEGGGFGGNASKATNKLWVYFPDTDAQNGINPQIIDDLLANKESFKIQAVSPLGYFSEVYSFNNEEAPLKDAMADMITYARVLHDEGQINPSVGDYGAEGITSAGNNYVGYGAYRKNNAPAVYSGNAQGDHLFSITDVTEQSALNGRGNYLVITLDQPIYVEQYGNGDRDETTNNVREFQEPLYVVNLVREEAEIIDSNTTQFNYTGHYQKLTSLVANGTGGPMNIKLVSERWEDCIQDVSTNITNAYSSLERFVWVENSLGETQRWLNVTNKTAAQINAILSDIQTIGFYTADGFPVYGVYKHVEENINQHIGFILKFEVIAAFPQQYMIPQQGARIEVHYDNRIPIRVFGGDTWINESIWSPIDMEYNKNGNPVSGEFLWNMPMPYNKYKLSPDIDILKDGGGLIDHIQLSRTFNFDAGFKSASIRQWVTMWTAETRINLSFAFNDDTAKESIDQYFPLKNYVMRPNKWSTSNDGTANGMYTDNKLYVTEYTDAYGDEFVNWGWGGFRFLPQTNIDYSKNQSNILLTSTPQFGFEEQTDYCTRIIWSEKRPVNVQNTPTVRTFPSNNYFDISDDTGCIKFGWSCLSSDKGNNLYAITDGGVCLLLVDKRVIHEINADELATVGSDIGGILNQLWIEKRVGMPDETWRSWAEYSNTLFWGGTSAVRSLSDNQVSNLCATGFQEIYDRKFLSMLQDGYNTPLCGGYMPLTQEYIINTRLRTIHSSLIYGTQQQMLQCSSSYNYDKYLYNGNRFYGMKNGRTFELGIGNQIDGEDIECYVTGVSDESIYSDKEFIRIRVNSNSKPSKIYFYDNYEQYKVNDYSSVVDASSSAVAIKDYFGYECYIPRKELAPHYRQQGRLVIFKIVSEEDENFLITSTGVQYKALK